MASLLHENPNGAVALPQPHPNFRSRLALHPKSPTPNRAALLQRESRSSPVYEAGIPKGVPASFLYTPVTINSYPDFSSAQRRRNLSHKKPPQAKNKKRKENRTTVTSAY